MITQKKAPNQESGGEVRFVKFSTTFEGLRSKLAEDGMTKEQKEKFQIVEDAIQKVTNGFEHESSRKLCELSGELGNIFKRAIIEAIQFPLQTEKKFPHLQGRPVIDKVTHLMTDVALVNLGDKNTIREDKEERRVLFKLLKDVGVNENDVTINLFGKRIPYNEDDTRGIVEVRVGNEYKNPEAVVYARLYELYHNKLEKLGFESKSKS